MPIIYKFSLYKLYHRKMTIGHFYNNYIKFLNLSLSPKKLSYVLPIQIM